ncbi:hypothetical protein WICPIJ_003151 [Wickerhamomyces pijperi]|uniref:Uncharacterized protein n=1 Tax=Wickerhamomyces pijperi TaxID=599730 RepID=A0A9P8TN95_WICPI|nr:hypothetical protein WICPIJ_003151 [Wickerhamomyces pijperi]
MASNNWMKDGMSLSKTGYWEERICVNSSLEGSSMCKVLHNLKPIKSGMETTPFLPFLDFSADVLMVEINWKPLAALITSPLEGMVNSLFSNKLSKTDKTSVGALSISSIKTQRPSMTAVVKTPCLHSNVPGLEPEVYVPSNNLASVCSPKWILTKVLSQDKYLESSLMRKVLPEPAPPISITGEECWICVARVLRVETDLSVAMNDVEVVKGWSK